MRGLVFSAHAVWCYGQCCVVLLPMLCGVHCQWGLRLASCFQALSRCLRYLALLFCNRQGAPVTPRPSVVPGQVAGSLSAMMAQSLGLEGPTRKRVVLPPPGAYG